MALFQPKRYYRGFSTRRYEDHGGTFDLYDLELIEEDILNEIFTVKGERLNMPAYGTRIPLLTFEPNDLHTRDVIKSELERVFSHEPRVELLDLDIAPAEDKYALIAIAKLRYLEFNVTRDLMIEINSQ